EDAGAFEAEGEGRHADLRQIFIEIAGGAFRHLAHEFQGEMQLVVALPAREPHPHMERQEIAPDILRQRQADEKTDHLGAPSRSRSAITGARRFATRAAPSALGCMPSAWLSSGRAATPSRKKGSKATLCS